PGHPIDEEQDMATLLLHNRLECIDQRKWEEPRTFRQREQAKRENAVDALAKAGNHESPFRIARREIFRFWRQADAVGLNEVGKDLLVAAFLKTVEFDGLLQQRIGDLLTIAQDTQTGLALGLDRDVPYWQADETVARFRIEFWPIDDRRLVR